MTGFMNLKLVTWTLCGLLLLCCGCDTTGEYNLRVAEAATRQPVAAVGAAGGLLFGQETPIGNPIAGQLRLPTFFGADAKTLQAEPRANTPFLKFPGFQYSYETAVDVAGKKVPVYAYIGVLAVGNQTADQLATAIKTEATTGIPGGAVNVLPNVQLSGSQLPFTRITATGTQEFDGTAVGGAKEPSDGRCEIFIHQTPTQFVLIGWRAPSAAIASMQFVAAVEASMATFRPAGEAPK